MLSPTPESNEISNSTSNSANSNNNASFAEQIATYREQQKKKSTTRAVTQTTVSKLEDSSEAIEDQTLANPVPPAELSLLLARHLIYSHKEAIEEEWDERVWNGDKSLLQNAIYQHGVESPEYEYAKTSILKKFEKIFSKKINPALYEKLFDALEEYHALKKIREEDKIKLDSLLSYRNVPVNFQIDLNLNYETPITGSIFDFVKKMLEQKQSLNLLEIQNTIHDDKEYINYFIMCCAGGFLNLAEKLMPFLECLAKNTANQSHNFTQQKHTIMPAILTRGFIIAAKTGKIDMLKWLMHKIVNLLCTNDDNENTEKAIKNNTMKFLTLLHDATPIFTEIASSRQLSALQWILRKFSKFDTPISVDKLTFDVYDSFPSHFFGVSREDSVISRKDSIVSILDCLWHEAEKINGLQYFYSRLDKNLFSEVNDLQLFNWLWEKATILNQQTKFLTHFIKRSDIFTNVKCDWLGTKLGLALNAKNNFYSFLYQNALTIGYRPRCFEQDLTDNNKDLPYAWSYFWDGVLQVAHYQHNFHIRENFYTWTQELWKDPYLWNRWIQGALQATLADKNNDALMWLYNKSIADGISFSTLSGLSQEYSYQNFTLFENYDLDPVESQKADFFVHVWRMALPLAAYQEKLDQLTNLFDVSLTIFGERNTCLLLFQEALCYEMAWNPASINLSGGHLPPTLSLEIMWPFLKTKDNDLLANNIAEILATILYTVSKGNGEEILLNWILNKLNFFSANDYTKFWTQHALPAFTLALEHEKFTVLDWFFEHDFFSVKKDVFFELEEKAKGRSYAWFHQKTQLICTTYKNEIGHLKNQVDQLLKNNPQQNKGLFAWFFSDPTKLTVTEQQALDNVKTTVQSLVNSIIENPLLISRPDIKIILLRHMEAIDLTRLSVKWPTYTFAEVISIIQEATANIKITPSGP